jgi:hypothetical protein
MSAVSRKRVLREQLVGRGFRGGVRLVSGAPSRLFLLSLANGAGLAFPLLLPLQK